jgi:hypothetical protein
MKSTKIIGSFLSQTAVSLPLSLSLSLSLYLFLFISLSLYISLSLSLFLSLSLSLSLRLGQMAEILVRGLWACLLHQSAWVSGSEQSPTFFSSPILVLNNGKSPFLSLPLSLSRSRFSHTPRQTPREGGRRRRSRVSPTVSGDAAEMPDGGTQNIKIYHLCSYFYLRSG